MPSRSFADTPEVTPSITIGNSGSLAFSVDPGQFNHGSQSITVLTTNYTGYTLTAVPSSGNDSRLENTATPTTSYISSISADKAPASFASAEYGFSTDTTITDSTTYHPVTASTKIKETDTATTTEQAGTFQLTIGAKAGSDTPAGSYTRTFTMTATANPAAYSISYNANAGSDTVTNFPSNDESSVVGDTVTISSKTPVRSGYLFVGWAETNTAYEATLQPSGTFTVDQTIDNPTKNLYAIWAAPLQDWDGCDDLSVGDIVPLYDTRDNQVYRATKWYMDTEPHDATNARCWMMDNLNLGAENLVVNTLDSTNTHLPSNGSKDVPVSDSDSDPTNDFTSWIKSSGSASYTVPELIPITASNSRTGSDTDTYGNKYGTLYNYSAASAGTYTYAEGAGVGNAYYDLCPSGWRLPTGGYDSSEYQDFYNGNFLNTTNVQSDYGFSLAGHFANGILYGQGEAGYYWASSINNNTTMFRFGVGASEITPATGRIRYRGTSVKCIQQKATHSLTINYGTGVSGVTIGGIAVANNSTLQVEEGVSYAINMTFDSGYEFDSWSATSGIIGSASTQSTTYTIGSSDATLTASVTAPLQTWNDCNSMNVGETIKLYDTRDNQSYRVSRLYMDSNQTLASARCWMMDNLNLGAVAFANGVTELNSSNTHLPSNGTKNVATSTFNTWKKTSASGNWTNPELIPVSGQDTYGNKYGTLYNYAAASAGTYTYARSAGVGNAQYDLCPSGWRLPTGGSEGEFQQLITDGYGITSSTAGSTSLQRDLKFPLAGNF